METSCKAQESQLGALWWPREVGWRCRVGGSRGGDICIHIAGSLHSKQKRTQHWKAIILQVKKKKNIYIYIYIYIYVGSPLFFSSLGAGFFPTWRGRKTTAKGGGPGKFCKLWGTPGGRIIPLPPSDHRLNIYLPQRLEGRGWEKTEGARGREGDPPQIY